MDRDRRKWTQFLYGLDWAEPSLYDLIINLERTSVEQACHAVASLVECGGYELSPEGQAAMDDLALASKVRAALAQDPFTLNLEVEVESRGGSILIRGHCGEETDDHSAGSWGSRRRDRAHDRRGGPSSLQLTMGKDANISQTYGLLHGFRHR